MQGLPCVRSTGVTVSAMLGQPAAGQAVEDVTVDYPQLRREGPVAVLEYVAAYAR